MTTRETAIKWWGMLGTKAQMQHAHGLDPERFPAPMAIPPFKAPEGLTGREIEQMWEAFGKPGVSMEFGEHEPQELLGRVVKVIHHGVKPLMFSFIEGVASNSFHVFNGGTFNIHTGSSTKRSAWDSAHCELSTREEWTRHSEEAKAQAKRRKLINAIIDHLQRKDGFAPTTEQVEAAAKELGLVKA